LTKPQKLTESGLARELEVSRQAVHALVKRGVLEKDAQGLIDREKATQALLNKVRPSGKTTSAVIAQDEPLQKQQAPLEQTTDQNSEITSYHIAKTLREAAEAQIARLKLAEMQGKYLVKADFERHLFNAGRMLRDTLTNCARRVGAEVAGLAAADECEAVIDREHRAALASFAQQLRTTLKIETEANPPSAPAA
jgi:hypothetical protein